MKYYATLSIPIRLICGKVFVQVGKRVTFGLDIRRRPRHSASGNGINACGVINVIWREAGIHDLFAAEIPRELVHNRPDHLKMIQLLRTYRGHSICIFQRNAARLPAFLHILHKKMAQSP